MFDGIRDGSFLVGRWALGFSSILDFDFSISNTHIFSRLSVRSFQDTEAKLCYLC